MKTIAITIAGSGCRIDQAEIFISVSPRRRDLSLNPTASASCRHAPHLFCCDASGDGADRSN
jgi:hypothetical protein